AFPIGTSLLLACDVRIGARGPFRMGLNEVAIGISPPGFAVELARSRLHPAWLSRTVTLGEMFEPDEAAVAGLRDRVVPSEEIAPTLESLLTSLKLIHAPSHVKAKQRLRCWARDAMRQAIDTELTIDAYTASAATRSTVVLPGANG